MRPAMSNKHTTRDAWRNLPRPMGGEAARPVTVEEEAAAVEQAYRGGNTGNQRRDARTRRPGALPNTINRLALTGRDWSKEPDQSPVVVAQVLKAKGGWRPYGAHGVRPAVCVPPPEWRASWEARQRAARKHDRNISVPAMLAVIGGVLFLAVIAAAILL